MCSNPLNGLQRYVGGFWVLMIVCSGILFWNGALRAANAHLQLTCWHHGMSEFTRQSCISKHVEVKYHHAKTSIRLTGVFRRSECDLFLVVSLWQTLCCTVNTWRENNPSQKGKKSLLNSDKVAFVIWRSCSWGWESCVSFVSSFFLTDVPVNESPSW